MKQIGKSKRQKWGSDKVWRLVLRPIIQDPWTLFFIPFWALMVLCPKLLFFTTRFHILTLTLFHPLSFPLSSLPIFHLRPISLLILPIFQKVLGHSHDHPITIWFLVLNVHSRSVFWAAMSTYVPDTSTWCFVETSNQACSDLNSASSPHCSLSLNENGVMYN